MSWLLCKPHRRSLQLSGTKRWRLSMMEPRLAPYLSFLYTDGDVYDMDGGGKPHGFHIREELNTVRSVTSTPDPDISFEKYRDSFAMSIAILFAKVSRSAWRKSSIHTPHHQFVYHDTSPICIAILFFRSIRVRGRWSTPGLNLSGPLNRLNAILSLLQPLDRYRTPSAIGSAIGRPLSRPISHPTAWQAQPRDSGAIVFKTPLKQVRNENAIEAAIVNRVLDRD